METAQPFRLREWNSIMPNGAKKNAANAGGNLPEDAPWLTLLAVDAGTWNDRVTSLNCAKAGKDHEVLVSCVHPLVVRVAVPPGGRPVTFR